MEILDLPEGGQKREHSKVWDNSKRAKNLILIFWILIGLTALGLISGYLELELLKDIQAGGEYDEDKATINDLRQLIIGIVQTGLFITSIVFFLKWFRRAYGNLHRLDVVDLKHTEVMAIWTWFIPIVSLIYPVQIMNDIWVHTQQQIRKYDSSYVKESGGLMIGAWWTLFVISNFIGNVILKTAFNQETIEEMVASSWVVLMSDFLQIPEALLVILIVTKLSKKETRLREEVLKAEASTEET